MTPDARRSIGAQRNPESETAILDAARQLLAEKGLGGFSIEEVARRARAGKPTIYRWWPSKTQLLLAVYGRIKGELVDPDTGSLEGDVAGFLGNVMAFWRETDAGAIFRSVVAGSPVDPDAHQALVDYHTSRTAHTAGLFARPHGATPPPTEAQSRLLAATVASYALVRLIMGTLDVTEGELREVAHQLVHGLPPPIACSSCETAP